MSDAGRMFDRDEVDRSLYDCQEFRATGFERTGGDVGASFFGWLVKKTAQG